MPLRLRARMSTREYARKTPALSPTQMPNYRQEVFNVLLAQLLQERGVISAPESMLRAAESHGRRMPDVLVNFNGLRLMIEGEVADQPDAESKALASASQRVKEGIAHIGVAVVYPEILRHTEFAQLKETLATGELHINVITESGTTGFFAGNVDRLRDALVNAFEALTREDIVAQAVALVDAAVEFFANAVVYYRGPRERLAILFGLHPPDDPTEPPKLQLDLSPKEIGAAARIGGLILLNAMIAQHLLAEHYQNMESLVTLRNKHKLDDYSEAFDKQWGMILHDIDYYPVFHLALQTLSMIGNPTLIPAGLERLIQGALEVVKLRVVLKHDLMGRVYHRLLADAKYLGTYYTSIPAATMLLRLALRPAANPIAWHDVNQMRQLRIADPACGTGTLLMAAAEAVTDNYFKASALASQRPNVAEMHRALTEDILYGYDVLPSAIHLTASTLALRAPEVSFKKMNLFSLPLGGPYHSLGSLEFLSQNQQQMPLDLFGASPTVKQATGRRDDTRPYAPLPLLDLCVMNPPFVRSVGDNLLFGSMPDKERAPMQKKLQQLVKDQQAQASITAGLGSVFIAIADRYVKPGGRIALILPKALLSGVSWGPSRALINQNYHIEYLIASQDPARWNFSESTDLSETMMVLRKMVTADEAAPPAIAINVWRNPTTNFDALTVTSEVTEHAIPDLLSGHGGFEIVLGHTKLGEAVAMAQAELKAQPSWLLPCAFAQSDLTRAAYHLQNHSLRLPSQRKGKRLPLCPLGELGVLGPDARDVHDGLKLSHHQMFTAYAAFWGHDSKVVTTLGQQPNNYLSPLPTAKPGRRLKRIEDLWPLAGRLLIAERLRLNTQKLTAIKVSEPVLSSMWWSFAFHKKTAAQRNEKALALWLNSTLGLLLMILNRVETEGAWVKFKKPILAAMPVLNVHELTAAQFKILTVAYDKLAEQTLQPLPNMADDPVRAAIDEALATALHLPDFSMLRTLLAKEPVVCLKPL